MVSVVEERTKCQIDAAITSILVADLIVCGHNKPLCLAGEVLSHSPRQRQAKNKEVKNVL